MMNEEEYWAEGSQAWFEATVREGEGEGTWSWTPQHPAPS